MELVGLANTRISTGYAQKSPQSLYEPLQMGSSQPMCVEGEKRWKPQYIEE